MKLILLVVFAAAMISGVLIVRTTSQPEVFLTITSPNGNYTVSLAGQKDRPKLPFVSHEVRFSVTKEGKETSTNNFLHSGDWLDPSFALWYPQHKWITENGLQFYKEEFFNDGQRERISVQNKTDKVIEYLRVTSIDSFLLFDIPPGATTTLTVSPPRSDNRWISVTGEFRDRQQIGQKGEGFSFGKDRKGPLTYFVAINVDGLTIGLEK